MLITVVFNKQAGVTVLMYLYYGSVNFWLINAK